MTEQARETKRYLFLRPCGEQIECDLTYAELTEANTLGTRYLIDGEECTRLVDAEMERDGEHVKKKRSPGQTLLWNRPFHSEALGVNPNQAAEAEAFLRSRGVDAQYDRETGALVTTSEKQFQEAAKALGHKSGRDGYDVSPLTGTRLQEKRDEVRRAIQAECDKHPIPPDIQQMLDRQRAERRAAQS